MKINRAHLVLIGIIVVFIFISNSAFKFSLPNLFDRSASWPTLLIYSGSENQALEPIIQEYAQKHQFKAKFHYEGSVDMYLHLKQPEPPMDVIWPASSLWINMADNKKVTGAESIMRSPVVFAVKRDRARALGWVGRPVSLDEILTTLNTGSLRFAMTSATQSNSGASALLSFLYAFSGNPDILSLSDVQDPAVLDKTRQLLRGVNRSSGSSGWLKDTFVAKYDEFDSMVNYESLIIEANQQLVSAGREPLYVIYPTEGVIVSDSPLALVDKGDSTKSKLFTELKKYLLSEEAQNKIISFGRRTGLGLSVPVSMRQVFNPDWGLASSLSVPVLKTPTKEVIQEALSVYQLSLRKPSFTVYAVDVSGSMEGQGLTQLKSALESLINQDQAKAVFLQATPRDVQILLPFNSQALAPQRVTGNDPNNLFTFLSQVRALDAGGGTDIYAPVLQAQAIINSEPNINTYFPAIILMTDGKSNSNRLSEINSSGDVPVFSILFGDADDSQLKALSAKTSGQVFDGRKDLLGAFRKAKGYN